ncbi:MAG: protein translocase subunit SecD [Chitinispirillaceae bacterium]|nr:protein translocase subunit SecD [Chitinispirillaceae bacterium]
MKKNNPLTILLILAAVALTVYFLIPSFIFYSKNHQEREVYAQKNPRIFRKILNLGLDLQGGMRLVLEIDRSNLDKEAEKDVLDRAYTIIENRINALGVAEPVIQKQGKDRIIVELPGLKDETAAKGVIGRTAQLEFKLLREPAQLERAITVIDNELTGKKEKEQDSAAIKDSTERKAQEGQKLAEQLFEGTESVSDTDSAAVEEAESVDNKDKVASFKDLLVQIGDQVGVKIDNVPRVQSIFTRVDIRHAIERAGLGANSFLWGHDTTKIEGALYRILYYVKSAPEMRGDIIKDASASIDQSGMRAGGAKVDMEMNAKGARRFSSVTAANVNKFLAIVLDSTIYSAPRIIQKIPLGRAEITGSFTMEEAKNLAIVLRAGALPAPVRIIEERTVGPSLGQDSIDKGIFAGIIGAIVVLVFMIVYYRLSGVIALIALILNISVVLAAMTGVHATLTLPGIAGIILLVGMGVDANVIIFERIREELRVGKTVRSAIDAGYERAFVTVMDSNLTTLITAFILFWKGTGPIRGFAITLIFGIISSLFTALFVSRILMNFFSVKNVNKLSI